MQGGQALAGWLVVRRAAIEAELRTALGEAAPAGGSAEAEALRRFRSFLLLALTRGAEAVPSLEGLRVGERRARRVLEAWLASAGRAAGPEQAAVEAALAPLVERFTLALRETARARRASGAPVPGARRAVSAAIDRISDAFLAIDVETGSIVDANPAAGALLGTTRDRLLAADAMAFVPAEGHADWWAQLDAVSEGAEPRRFRASLRDADGRTLSVEASVTRFATRTRTLALVLARS